VKTGMLASAGIVEVVAAKMREHTLRPLVVDPVMVAKGGSPLLGADAVGVLRERLLPLATVVTPNLPEAAALTRREVADLATMRDAARAILDLGPECVIVKGGHLEGAAIDLLYDGSDFVELAAERIATPNTHGTGCIFASALATGLARGRSVHESAAAAKRFVTAAIRGGLALGRGHGPADPLAALGRSW
jgi:hydroxymethylpyrimidine/phosphomethylpyrimidine kinase